LAFHVIRPSFATFTSYLTNSPKLRFLGLNASGPQMQDPESDTSSTVADEEHAEAEYQQPRGMHPVEVPSLSELSVARHLPDYAHSLAKSFYFPNITELSLHYTDGNYTKAIMAYATPYSSMERFSSRRSTFQLVQCLQVTGLDIFEAEARHAMFEDLVNLKHLRLGVTDCGMWDTLRGNALALERKAERRHSARQDKEEGHGGSILVEFVEAREAIGRRLTMAAVHSNTAVSLEVEDWLRNHVEEFGYFSDVEAEETDDDDDDDDGFVGCTMFD
ncbi:hypothetical protein BKA70DRAFT_1531547, partial [Coprinopsis sp. MPI-PUGE-AT-0042]